MEFDAASIEKIISNDPGHTNVPLNDADVFPPNGGLLSALDFPLLTYIRFAYKLSIYQMHPVVSQLPEWANTEGFDIQARAHGDPTKDQMRLMMQALLADRFKLTVHMETRQLPVVALVLNEHGKTGPQLHPHSDDPLCVEIPPPGAASTPPPMLANGLSLVCGAILRKVESDQVLFGGRNLTIAEIAKNVGPIAAEAGALPSTLPVYDLTGLSGKFDFWIKFTPRPDTSRSEIFTEALQEQHGLKLKWQTVPLEVPVIDHVEEPAPN
jgi:bla regulator protein BlaR1